MIVSFLLLILSSLVLPGFEYLGPLKTLYADLLYTVNILGVLLLLL